MYFCRRFLPLAAAFLLGLGPLPAFAQKPFVQLPRALEEQAARRISVWKGQPLRFAPLARPVSYRPPFRPVSLKKTQGLSAAYSQAVALRLQRLAASRKRVNIFPGKQTVDAVIFDLDGTLLDSLTAWENSGSNFLRSQGIEPPEGLDEQLAKMSLLDGARLVKKMYGLPQPPEELLRLTLQPVRAHYERDVPAKPGVPEMLRRLKAQGIKLCVATASDRELAEAALRRLGLLDLFDFILTCDEAGAGKRSPAVYEAALQKLGTSKTRTLVVEDALYALQTAHRAGFPTAAVADAHSAADQALLRQTADYYLFSFASCRIEK